MQRIVIVGDRLRGALDDHSRLGRCDELAHSLNQPADRLSRLAPEAPGRPDQVVRPRRFVGCNMIVCVHRADEQRDQRFVKAECSSSCVRVF
jgi:hypothetical protein